MILLAIIICTFASEIANQVTTLTGYYHGFYELDPTARTLFSTIGPAGETQAVFAIPVCLTLFLYLLHIWWKPSTTRSKQARRWATIVLTMFMVLLAINTTGATISDYYALHSYHLL